MIDAPQSSPALRWLPACVLVLGSLAPVPASGQERQRTTVEAEIAKAPGEQMLGRLAAGATVTTGKSDREWTQVTLDGWIISRSLMAVQREGFDLSVGRRQGEYIRVAPKGALLGRLSSGALLHKVEVKDGWTHVQRTAWVLHRVLQSAGTGVAADAAGTTGPGFVELTRGSPLLESQEGRTIGSLSDGARARVLSRSGDWVKIQIEGWVRDSATRSTDSTVLRGVSQAEVRANPSRYTGRVVEWRVQFIALQTADELRPEIPVGQTYLLTRGPLPEPGFVYVILPVDKVAQFRQVTALQELVLRVTVRSPTTKYLPNPVVELVSVEKGL